MAALLVCLEHLRAFLFVPFAQIKSPNVLERGFYFVTGLGHQAVMIFFVLSGFLVGGSVISAHQMGKWSWTSYALRRLTRLWLVLIPALLLTLLWDTLGQRQSPTGYHGEFHAIYNSGPTINAPTDLQPLTFLGNTFFLQTISVNCFGTNGPLWSLANEFWYYLLFPLLLGSLVRGAKSETLKTIMLKRAVYLGLLVTRLILLPWGILMGGLVWLMGAAVVMLIRQEQARKWATHPVWLITSALLALGLLAASRFGKLGPFDDLLLGAGCALLVAALAVRPAGPGIYARLSADASEYSYTLYLVHFPVLAFLFYTVFKGQQLSPGIYSAFWFALMLTSLLIYAAAIYWCFERNTDRFRKWLEDAWKSRGSKS